MEFHADTLNEGPVLLLDSTQDWEFTALGIDLEEVHPLYFVQADKVRK